MGPAGTQWDYRSFTIVLPTIKNPGSYAFTVTMWNGISEWVDLARNLRFCFKKEILKNLLFDVLEKDVFNIYFTLLYCLKICYVYFFYINISVVAN